MHFQSDLVVKPTVQNPWTILQKGCVIKYYFVCASENPTKKEKVISHEK